MGKFGVGGKILLVNSVAKAMSWVFFVYLFGGDFFFLHLKVLFSGYANME